MKKIYIVVTLLFSVIFSANVLQAKTFTRSTEMVSFAGADYTLLKSPFADGLTVNGYWANYSQGQDEITLGYFIPHNKIITTEINSIGQYKYGSIAKVFRDVIYNNWYDDSVIWYNDYFDLITKENQTLPQYHINFEYTFSSPSDIIVNVDTVGWFQASSNVSKISLDIYTYAYYNSPSTSFKTDMYLTYYDNNNVVINSSGAFGGLNTYIGIAFYGISQVDYDSGYNAGQKTGETKGLTEGYDNGYKDGKKDYGYNDNGTIITGDSAFNKGYTKGSTDNMPNFFVLMTDGVFTAVSRIGNIEVLPNLKISYIAGIILALGLVKFITGRKGDD